MAASEELWAEPTVRAAAVLVVEDEVLVRLAIADHLRECGFVVYEAGNVAEAQSIFLAEVAVDVVFSDIQMPGGLDGFALARWVRERSPGVAIILTSGAIRMARDVVDLCDQGSIVAKPYTQQAIVSQIQTLLSKRDRAKG